MPVFAPVCTGDVLFFAPVCTVDLLVFAPVCASDVLVFVPVCTGVRIGVVVIVLLILIFCFELCVGIRTSLHPSRGAECDREGGGGGGVLAIEGQE